MLEMALFIQPTGSWQTENYKPILLSVTTDLFSRPRPFGETAEIGHIHWLAHLIPSRLFFLCKRWRRSRAIDSDRFLGMTAWASLPVLAALGSTRRTCALGHPDQKLQPPHSITVHARKGSERMLHEFTIFKYCNKIENANPVLNF